MISFYFYLIESEEQKNKFEYIYKKYYGLMYHVAFSIVKDKSLAEDCVSETCISLIKMIDDIRTDTNKELVSFLRILTKSRTIDYLRKWNHSALISYDDCMILQKDYSVPEEIILTNSSLNESIKKLYSIPEKFRKPLLLRVKGFSTQEIAQALNLSPETVRTRIFRARKILSDSFEK